MVNKTFEEGDVVISTPTGLVWTNIGHVTKVDADGIWLEVYFPQRGITLNCTVPETNHAPAKQRAKYQAKRI